MSGGSIIYCRVCEKKMAFKTAHDVIIYINDQLNDLGQPDIVWVCSKKCEEEFWRIESY